ncbi:Hypothetical protein FKW44_017452 [Caligus rogercresseyi]|uniref:Uncharacterized protein n=1 Tax=Caligus rogercresseyi TaxID=217165 RepID=A0A7T8GTH3_CALRO|nr:Hypothetical protein FKW44_017452 [Caligus rogercresseyi]
MPHYCAWRGSRVLWPRVWNPNTPSLCLAGQNVLWPRVRNPNTPSLCLAGPESSLAED